MSALIIRLGVAHFRRENLLGREIDMLNLGWVWRTFLVALTGSDQPAALTRYLRSVFKRTPADETQPPSLAAALWADLQAIGRWYRQDVRQALTRLASSFWITLLIGAVSAGLAFFYVSSNLPATALSQATLDEALKTIRSMLLDQGPEGISSGFLFWHNLRAELVMVGLGVFSFGVLSLLALIANFVLIGAVLGLVQLVNLSPLTVFMAGILPHGLFELPSVILACAVILHFGLRLVTPESGRSIGETLIVTLADVIKILVAVCLPLLIIAALVEANLTPRILLAVLGHALEIRP